jgi:alpha-galactosidase
MRARSRFRYLLAPLPIVRSGNNCACADHCTELKCFVGDVNAVIAWGFDSVKLDGCGRQENIQLWYDLFNWTLSNTPGGKPMLLENCHNGPRTGSPAAQSPFGPFAPTRDWCPFHMYRSSNDIRPQWGSILSNLQTIPPLAEANLSRPGCWAYPDMLEVGITVDGAPVLNFTEARTHFGAWCIVSSPLILGLNMSDSANVAAFWPILSNEEAIAVNQECVRASARARAQPEVLDDCAPFIIAALPKRRYAGMSGTRFWESSDVTRFSPCGWGPEFRNCTYASQMYWYKPLPGGDVAVLLMNNADTPALLTLEWDAVPGLLPPQGSLVRVRDIWNHASLGTFEGAYVPDAPTPSRDSIFLRLTPVQAE